VIRRKTISHNQDIHATDQAVWKHITEVELSSFSHRWWLVMLGVPKPLHAEIHKSGVGGKRVASFDNGKCFSQDITVWEPYKVYDFQFHADPGFRVGYVLDLASGPFRMVSGRYIIRESGNGVQLTLQSIYELHGFLGLLLQLPVYLVLVGFQRYLLQGIKKNAEEEHA